MNRRRARTKTAVVLVAGVLMTSACTGGPAPIVTETPFVAESTTPSPSPTPSPTATALTDEEVIEAIPEEARMEDFPGAQEFARFFLEEYHDLMRKDPRLFSALSAPSCVFCLNVEEHYASAAREGHTLTGGRVAVTTSLAQGGLQDDGTWGVVVDVSVDTLTEADADGSVVQTTEGGPGTATLLLEYAEYWRVLEVAAEQE